MVPFGRLPDGEKLVIWPVEFGDRCTGFAAATLFILASFTVISFPARAQQIVLLVNGSPITDLDIAHREKLLEMSNHKKPSHQEAINSLVDACFGRVFDALKS